MAGIVEILLLGAIGFIINKKISKPDFHNNNNKSMIENKNTVNIYNQDNSEDIQNYSRDHGIKRYKKSLDFKNTCIIPKHYKDLDEFQKNTKNKVRVNEYTKTAINDSNFDINDPNITDNNSKDSKFSDQNQSQSTLQINPPNHESFVDQINAISDNRKFESRLAKSPRHLNKFNEKNTWIHQLDPMKFDNTSGPVASNGINDDLCRNHSDIARIELERDMAINGGYSSFDKHDDGTYGVVNPNSIEFNHTNMVPNVRKGPSIIQEAKRADLYKRKLELFTGSTNNIDWKPKIERAPLFSPLIGAQNIYGSPVRTPEFESRYFPGKERRNEFPIQQIMVTPGLNLGPYDVGKQGYQEPVRPNCKNS